MAISLPWVVNRSVCHGEVYVVCAQSATTSKLWEGNKRAGEGGCCPPFSDSRSNSKRGPAPRDPVHWEMWSRDLFQQVGTSHFWGLRLQIPKFTFLLRKNYKAGSGSDVTSSRTFLHLPSEDHENQAFCDLRSRLLAAVCCRCGRWTDSRLSLAWRSHVSVWRFGSTSHVNIHPLTTNHTLIVSPRGVLWCLQMIQ